MRYAIALGLLTTTLLPAVAAAEDYAATPSNYRDLITNLGPGDRLLLGPGEYAGLPVRNLEGTSDKPIVITGEMANGQAIITGRSCCNTISIVDSSYVVLSHLKVDARGELVDGVKVEAEAAFAHHITIEYLELYGFAQDQQVVGISTKAPAWDWTIRNNIIRDVGTGMYFGNSDGADPFVRGIIENNLVIDPIGYAIQLKHQLPRPGLPGMPVDGSVTVIRHNVLTKASGASRGDDARPNLLIGHLPLSGVGQNDRYDVYGNFLFQNESGTEPLFQGEGNIGFYDNILVNTYGDGAWFIPHNDVPKEIAVFHNTVYVAGTGVRISGGSAQFSQRAFANAVFSGEGIRGGDATDNVTAAMSAASQYVLEPGDTAGQIDFYPLAGKLEDAAVDLSSASDYTAYDRDFNGTERDGRFRGAYAGDTTNPGWKLQIAIKDLDDTGTPPVGGPNPPGPDPDPTPDPNDPNPSDPSTDDGGCVCVTPSPARGGAVWWLLAGLAWALRRRKRGF